MNATCAGRMALATVLIAVAMLAVLPGAQANLYKGTGPTRPAISAGTDTPVARQTRTTSRARAAIPVSPLPPGKGGARAVSPVIVANSTAAGQTGYVHYFLIRLPDDSLEVQVGIELPDQQIAWSFPGLGVAVSPFMSEGVIAAGGSTHEVWHLYGIRPFPDDAAMSALQRELPGRIERWVHAAIPYCVVDGQGGNCMSCLGFVLRALYPGRGSDEPGLPRDFWRTDALGRYTTNDLLLYLTGMLDLPTRGARLRRITQLALPEGMRSDLEELVYGMGAHESSPSRNSGAAPKNPLARETSRASPRPTQRRRL